MCRRLVPLLHPTIALSYSGFAARTTTVVAAAMSTGNSPVAAAAVAQVSEVNSGLAERVFAVVVVDTEMVAVEVAGSWAVAVARLRCCRRRSRTVEGIAVAAELDTAVAVAVEVDIVVAEAAVVDTAVVVAVAVGDIAVAVVVVVDTEAVVVVVAMDTGAVVVPADSVDTGRVD